MITEQMLELLILERIFKDYSNDREYSNYLDKNYNVEKLQARYLELGKEFLNEYALDKTEKSD